MLTVPLAEGLAGCSNGRGSLRGALRGGAGTLCCDSCQAGELAWRLKAVKNENLRPQQV
jgi:hypothetical protein